MILLFHYRLREMRFDLYSGTKAIFLSFILDLSISAIYTIFILLDQIICTLAMKKYLVLG